MDAHVLPLVGALVAASVAAGLLFLVLAGSPYSSYSLARDVAEIAFLSFAAGAVVVSAAWALLRWLP